MTRFLSILFLIIGCNVTLGEQLKLAWLPDPSAAAFMVLQGASSGSYDTWLPAPGKTNFCYPPPLRFGVSYFAVIAWIFDAKGNIHLSAASNEIIITNTLEFLVTTTNADILTSPKITGPWTDMGTNRMLFEPTLPAEYFRSTNGIWLTPTNHITSGTNCPPKTIAAPMP